MPVAALELGVAHVGEEGVWSVEGVYFDVAAANFPRGMSVTTGGDGFVIFLCYLCGTYIVLFKESTSVATFD